MPPGRRGEIGGNVSVGHPTHETEATEASAVTHCGYATSYEMLSAARAPKLAHWASAAAAGGVARTPKDVAPDHVTDLVINNQFS